MPFPGPPTAPQNKSGLRRIAAHRLRALYCCWIIQELAERKRQREWGVCTLSPGETGAKEGASLEEWVTAAKSLKTPAEDKRRKTQARNPYCSSLLFSSPIRDTVNSPLLNGRPSIYHEPFIITCHNIITSLDLHKPRCIDTLISVLAISISNPEKAARANISVCQWKQDSFNFEVMCVLAVEGERRRELARLYDEYGSIVQPCLPPQGTICSLSMHHLLVWAVSRATRGGGGLGEVMVFDGRGRRWGQRGDWQGGGDWWERGRWANVVLCWWKRC